MYVIYKCFSCIPQKIKRRQDFIKIRDTWTPRMPNMMKNVIQMRTMLPMGRNDDSKVCTTNLRPGALLMTL